MNFTRASKAKDKKRVFSQVPKSLLYEQLQETWLPVCLHCLSDCIACLTVQPVCLHSLSACMPVRLHSLSVYIACLSSLPLWLQYARLLTEGSMQSMSLSGRHIHVSLPFSLRMARFSAVPAQYFVPIHTSVSLQLCVCIYATIWPHVC
jgi:hypothetical protein